VADKPKLTIRGGPVGAGATGPYFHTPSSDAVEAGQALVQRARERTHMPLRRAFAELAPGSPAPVTPLAQMIRGGRGGSVRLRLYLSMLYLAAGTPYEVTFPSRSWAALLDLDDPAIAGARRIADAIKWLQDHRYVVATPNPGGPKTVRLLSDLGDGQRYIPPGAAYNRLRGNPEAAAIHRYIRLPSTLWSSGWMATLSTAALSMLLVLYVQRGASDNDEPVWIAPDYAHKTFLLSEDTRSRGLQELERAQLVKVHRRRLAMFDAFDVRRFRNVYTIDETRFEEPAAIPERSYFGRIRPEEGTDFF
jgi:hypothetical protein